MTDLEEFQQAHGQQWALILQNPAFSAGMIFLSIRTIEGIKNISDDEIERNSKIILADLRGRLRHEAEQFALSIRVEPMTTGEPTTEYPDSVEENFAEMELRKPKTDL